MILPEHPEKGKSTQEGKSEYLKIKYNWRSDPFAPSRLVVFETVI